MQRRKVVFWAQTKVWGSTWEIRNNESAGLCYNPIPTGIPREAGIARGQPISPACHVDSYLELNVIPSCSLDAHWFLELRFDSIFGGVTF